MNTNFVAQIKAYEFVDVSATLSTNWAKSFTKSVKLQISLE